MRIEGPDGEPLERVSFKYTKEDAGYWAAVFRKHAEALENLKDSIQAAGVIMFVADSDEDDDS